MPNELDSTSIHTRYAEQIATDLEANRAEQASIAARLEQLRAEEKWLATTLDSLPTGAPESSVTGPDEAVREAAVPQPRETREATPAKKPAAKKPAAGKTAAGKTAAGKTAVKRAPAAKAAADKAAAKTAKAPVEKAAARKTAAKKSAGGTPKAQSAPTLGTLIDGLLEEGFLGEPLKVNEIHAELTKARPERSTSIQVVRNALEGLVKKGRVEKDTRQGVALYTKPEAADSPHAGAGATAPAGAPVEAVAAGT
ncbi:MULTISPECIES: hypothetical protein [unclassified Streptomyces]|uniref:hypothetical protein n=1 Tax=unclassified Streptomyces TaxID=2593676 RepID=UPI0006AF22B6|nr:MULTISPECIES: hypothetical protein [unclassified Streptomyces]